MNRLQEKYNTEVKANLMKKFGFTSSMECPKLVKIVINMGVGEAVANPKALEEAAAELLILKQRIGESTDPDTAQTIFGKIAAVLTAVTNIDFSSIAKEETLSSGILRILQELAPKATQAQLESATTAIINALPKDYAKQGANTEATNTAILETTDTIDKKIGVAPVGSDKSTIFTYLTTKFTNTS